MAMTVLPASTPEVFTAAGTRLPVVLLLPSWPEVLAPHAASVPSVHSTTVCITPAAMAMTVLPASTPAVFTSTGRELLIRVLLPSWPPSLFPQAASVPSEHNARLCPPPAATAMTVLPASMPELLTATGTELLVVLPSPSWPLLLSPQAAKVPSEHSARP